MEHFNRHPEPPTTLAVVPHGRAPANSAYPIYDGARPYGNENNDDTEESGLVEYWRILHRYRWPIFLSSLAGAILGILVGLPMTPIYRASTSLEVLNVNENFMNTKETSPVTTADFSYDISEEETQVELLQGDSLQDRVFAKLDPNYSAGKLKRPASSGWRRLLHLPDPGALTLREQLLDKASRSLKVKATPRTRIIEITADSRDPQLALDFVNTLTNEFIEQNVEARRKTTQKVSDWLGGEIEDARTKLRRAEDALQAYAGTSGLIFTDQDSEETNIATEKLQQLQQELSTATDDRITKQSNYELAQHSPPEALPDVLNDQGLRDAMASITALRGQIADMSERFTPEYSKVKSAQAQLAALQASFEHDRAAIVERVKNDYQEAVQKEKLLATAYDTQTKEVLGQGAKAVQYNILKRDVDSSRQLYDTMLQQMKGSSVAAALHASNVRVADPAELPEKPVWPSFKILGSLGLFAGLFSSLGIVIFRERTDRTLQQPGDVQYWTNLLELGSIPSFSAMKTAKRYALPSKSAGELEGAARNGRSAALQPGQLQTVDLITWKQGASVIAEAFRGVLTSILFVGENGSSPRVLVFTSAGPGDGKTTVASNLAIAMAEIGRRVLLIDADLRRPRMHDLFKLPNDCGLSDLLKEHGFSGSTADGLIQETQIPGLHLLPSGPPTQAAANLLYSPNLVDLLAKCKEEYDIVIIDTPPMLQMTDARVIGRLADGVILVARAEQTTRDAIMAASQRFAEDRVRVLGTVLNDWNPKSASNGYYGYYRSSYYSTYHN
jgi:succinoglycan biosynthesis transport protein ExoP